jgi:RHS repeat-associated protein
MGLLGSITAPSAYPRMPPVAHFNTYDADGNLASDGATTHTWTAAGKPATSTTAATKTTYTHSADGRRLTESTTGKTLRYLWDPLSPQILSTTDGKSDSRYTYGRGLLSTIGPNTTSHTTTPSGTVLSNGDQPRSYEPFGTQRPAAGAEPAASTPSPGFAGGLQLPTGNYLFGQREYDPKAGTFLSPDQGGSSHPYSYAGNNPLTNTDLTGLDDINGALTDVSHMSGWVSIGTFTVGVACTIYRACAPAIPILMQVSSATGMAAGLAGGALTAQACVAKGNCSDLVANMAIIGVTSRFPGGSSLRSGAAVGQFEHQAGLRTRLIHYRPKVDDPNWGLTARHLNKHVFGDGVTSLRTLDPGGSTDQWVGYLQDLASRPSTITKSDGVQDIVGSFPRADGTGTFRLGIRVSPRADGSFDLITILTRQVS